MLSRASGPASSLLCLLRCPPHLALRHRLLLSLQHCPAPDGDTRSPDLFSKSCRWEQERKEGKCRSQPSVVSLLLYDAAVSKEESKTQWFFLTGNGGTQYLINFCPSVPETANNAGCNTMRVVTMNFILFFQCLLSPMLIHLSYIPFYTHGFPICTFLINLQRYFPPSFMLANHLHDFMQAVKLSAVSLPRGRLATTIRSILCK